MEEALASSEREFLLHLPSVFCPLLCLGQADRQSRHTISTRPCQRTRLVRACVSWTTHFLGAEVSRGRWYLDNTVQGARARQDGDVIIWADR